MSMATVEENASWREDPEAVDSDQSTTAAGGQRPGPAKARLPGIDLIRVFLTWGILFQHTLSGVFLYVSAPSDPSNDTQYYLRQIARAIVGFMDVWQMPMFFFLSGVSSFHALNRRSEKEFRKERVHRLLVPYLVLVLTNGVYSITFLAPRSFYLNPSPSTTYSEWLMYHYVVFSAGQGWFCLTLFIFSQVNKTNENCTYAFYSQNSLQQYLIFA